MSLIKLCTLKIMVYTFYEEILKNVKNYLKNQYLIAFEMGETQGEAIKEMAYHIWDIEK